MADETNNNPAAAKKNEHHTLEYRSEAEWWDENFPRGTADGDWFGYPGEEA
jgi:hypothetical protein